MRDRLIELELTNSVEVVIISFTTRELALAHAKNFGLTFPVLLDHDRATYGAFGLARAPITRVWGWRAARRYLQLYSEGKRRMSTDPTSSGETEDTRQLGGDFVLRDGLLRWGYWSEGSDDRPDPAVVVAECVS